MKKGIRYIRISKERQSNFSIDAQLMYTAQWFERNNVELADTFIDDGYTAQNFDRPDFGKLEAFISMHHKRIDYLVVNNFDRFSRDAGEALMKIKMLQNKYSINVVSVVEGVTFDKNDPGSFFYTGLLLLKGEDEIIRHKNRVNLGIYTAKKQFGRYLGAAPYGYDNARDDQNKPIIVINDAEAAIIRYMYDAFISRTPLYLINQEARKMGFRMQSNSAVQRILQNHVYTSLLKVKGFKDFPDEVVEAIHPPIIDRHTWLAVQEKFAPVKARFIADDTLPLRGSLLCHCGKKLTGAPSTGKSGRHYFYYKCPTTSKHNNISAIKAHAQLTEMLSYLSLPHHLVTAIKEKASALLEIRLKENSKTIVEKKREYDAAEKQLISIEEKYIADKMQFDTYNRWHTDITQKKINLSAQISKLSQDQSEVWTLLDNQLERLQDLSGLYTSANTLQKQSILKRVFDSKLYYREGVYRTPYIMPVFTRNLLILKEKKLLIYDKSGVKDLRIPSGGADGTLIELLTDFLYSVQNIKTA